MRTHTIGLLAFLLATGFSSFAQDTVKVGTYITSLYDIDLAANSYQADFWLWFIYENDSIAPMETLEVVNAKSVEYSLDLTEKIDTVLWASKKCRALLKQSWEVAYFPFDEQVLEIVLEESDADLGSLVYVIDSLNTKLDQEQQLPDWEIKDFSVQSGSKIYDTSYGDPRLDGQSTYARVELSITLRRKSFGLFLTLFTGVYVSFFISLLVFYIDPIHVDPRFGLSVGSLFAAVGNKYIVDSILPQTVAFGLADQIHIVTYISILLCIILSVFSLRWYKHGRVLESRRLDRRAFWLILLVYLGLNVGMVILAT
ncbi:MAG: hypothetical protein AAGH79_05900 [Bacteroidota bacterium]